MKTVANMFAIFFLQQTRVPGIAGSISRFRQNSPFGHCRSLASQTERQTHRQTDRRKSDLVSRAYYVTTRVKVSTILVPRDSSRVTSIMTLRVSTTWQQLCDVDNDAACVHHCCRRRWLNPPCKWRQRCLVTLRHSLIWRCNRSCAHHHNRLMQC